MTLNIGVIGIGKLGICYSIILAKANFKVYVYDIIRFLIRICI